jgi:hypothetical protein
LRVAAEAEVRDQDSVWAAVSLAAVAEAPERAGPAVQAPVQADQVAGAAAQAAPEVEVAAGLMPEICGARQGKVAVVVATAAPALAVRVDPEEVAEALALEVEVLAAAQVVRVDPDVVAEALGASEVALEVEAAPDQAAALEVVAVVAHQEVLSDPAALRANG